MNSNSTIEEDELVSVLPIHFSNALNPNIQLHQFPLLSRPLQTPPSAVTSGKRIQARIKPGVRRLEIHVPVDPRPEVWNSEKSRDLGSARQVDDREKNQDSGKGKQRDGEESKLTEVRLRSEQIHHQGAYMLGVIRNGRLNLHPIEETHQFRPTLTYLDVLSRRSKRSRGGESDDDSDDGPPPDPDEVAPPPTTAKKEKKPLEVKEVQVAARKAGDDKAGIPQGGLSAARREILHIIRAEEDEGWEDLEFYDGESAEAGASFEATFSRREDQLECKMDMTGFLKSIPGL
ncbi:hypothetical protein CONPUDRAFT_115069 [Coniophora puteana RWD-64-598 SS2]|uniref:DNA-directed RNA polymerase III subunit Rpc5 n=1 Tax=Coniophora puteana (strain RWD-64-598) TaxID=741705 RepID=A0A5M3N684_CONPW|nr:uncharacterized protein CONPUDRAFT_115069 [Coniophora puteana RWD-64-598 SS2]EIW86584.1 hypothetical protein CONPUDRAFT_115069 [Coniophora puteana RWD-64-598 SS2]